MKKFLAFLLALMVLCTPLAACGTGSQTSELTNSDKTVEKFVFPEGYVIDSSKFYFSQLNDIEKEIYLNLLNSKDSLIANQSAVLFQRNTEDDLWADLYSSEKNYERALSAYWLDNPMTSMWLNPIDTSVDYKKEKLDGTRVHQIYITSDNEKGTSFPTSAELQAAIAQVENTVQQFVKTLHGSDSEKVNAIHDWIIQDAIYEEISYSRNIYGALIEKKAICFGFAHAFKYVCDVAGLNTVTIYGQTHAWNYVLLEDGRWYLVDTTWDLKQGDAYLLVEIEPEFTSGKRCYEDFYGFSYNIFTK